MSNFRRDLILLPLQVIVAFTLVYFASCHPNLKGHGTIDLNVSPWNNKSINLPPPQPHLLFDHQLLDKLATFTRERIPPRIVHAKGHGAFGSFRVTHDVSNWTKADVFNGIGKTTPVFVRFSFTTMDEGASEAEGGNRGFAIRFYTQDGNLDFPGLQIDAFPVRDPALFPDLIHSIKRDPVTNFKNDTIFQLLFRGKTEVVHFHVKFYEDATRARSNRAINGSAVNVYECVNARGEVVYCKFSWRSPLPLDWMEFEEIEHWLAKRPDYFAKDLYYAIKKGNYPKWTFGLQVMTFEEAAGLSFNPFDVTKVWGWKAFPFIPIGEFVLDQNPTDHFSQVEQVAFAPNFVPGIRSSPDRVLQARTFAYKDAQRYRLGPDFEKLAINRALEGVKRSDEPTSSGIFPTHSYSYEGDEEDFGQPRNYLANEIGSEERARIATRLAGKLVNVPTKIYEQVIKNCISPLGKEFTDLVVEAVAKAQLLLPNDEFM